jgi:hypothetical protein
MYVCMYVCTSVLSINPETTELNPICNLGKLGS